MSVWDFAEHSLCSDPPQWADLPPMIGVSEHPPLSVSAAWDTIARISAHLRSSPSDLQARLEIAESLITLGLRSLAIHELKTLAEHGFPLSDLADPLTRAESLPDDVVAIEQSESILRSNLQAIGISLPDLDQSINRWRAIAQSQIRFQAVDTNIVRLLKDKGAVDQMQNTRGLFRSMLQKPLIELTKRQRGPIVLDGITPPWILQQLLEDDAQPSVPGFRQKLYVAQRDPIAFLEGLSIVDLSEKLNDERIEWFVGDDAVDQLVDTVNKRPGIAHSVLVIANPANSQALSKAIQESLLSISARDAESNLQLSARINERYASRDRAYWSERFKDERTKLRILIPTSRYTTYLQHACADLRDALEALGHECLLLTEPNDSSLMISSDYLSAIDKFDPDLLIAMNHTRASFSGLLPKELPVLTWIQDAMGHLFNNEQGESVGELDFVVGMIHRDLIDKFGFSEQQTQWHPMVASTSKFTDKRSESAPICEIAYVTHQSESVHEQCARLVREFAHELPDRQRDLETLVQRVQEIIATPGVRVHPELNRALDECFFSDSDPSSLPIMRANLLHGLVLPIAERYFRHQTIQWAADIAERHGWSLKLFGNGWESHPDFARYAQGPLEHGGSLASCYQSAVVHLHASIQQPLHQRVTECLLSGGLPITRVARDAFALMNNQAVIEAIESGTIHPVLDEQGNQIAGSIRVDQNQAATRMINTLRKLDLLGSDEFADGKIQWVTQKINDAKRDQAAETHRINAEQFASMTDLFFTNERTLESLLVNAIDGSDWRDQTRARVRRELAEAFTMNGFAQSAISFVRDRLGAS